MNDKINIDEILSSQKEYNTKNKKNNRIKPIVSVSVATYQQVNYIKECLDGILMQKTDFPFEINIGEDQSSDGTREICIEYAKRYPDIIRLFLRDRKVSVINDNSGNFIKSLNGILTLREANGKYVAICEGDDYWTDPLKLQKQVNFLESNEDYCLVYTDFDILNDKSKKILYSSLKRNKITTPIGNIYEDLLIGSPIGTLTICARFNVIMEVYRNELLAEKNFRSGDLPLWLGLSRLGKFYYIDESTATYRVRENSASHSDNQQTVYKMSKSTYEERLYYIKKYGCSINTERTFNYNYYNETLKNAFRFKDSKLGKTSYCNLLLFLANKEKISFNQRMYYLGTLNRCFWKIVRLLIISKSIYRRLISILINSSSKLFKHN